MQNKSFFDRNGDFFLLNNSPKTFSGCREVSRVQPKSRSRFIERRFFLHAGNCRLGLTLAAKQDNFYYATRFV